VEIVDQREHGCGPGVDLVTGDHACMLRQHQSGDD